ncbi:MAG: hypothetical protein AB7M12_12430 [Hyphomonadaceae bacterium]
MNHISSIAERETERLAPAARPPMRRPPRALVAAGVALYCTAAWALIIVAAQAGGAFLKKAGYVATASAAQPD